VEKNKFEVILVVNYPENSKPKITEYKDGNKSGEHFDRTVELAQKFNNKLNLHIVEQDFPRLVKVEENDKDLISDKAKFNSELKEIDGQPQEFIRVAGVGIASKLGMDIAANRQINNPGVIVRLGADTIFDKNFVREMISSFSNKKTKACRGNIGVIVNNTVYDEDKLIILDDAELSQIRNLANTAYEYSKKKVDFNNLIEHKRELLMCGTREKISKSDKQKEGPWAIDSKLYTLIGGMNIRTCGEDWELGNQVTKVGAPYLKGDSLKNLKVYITTRIEKPRANGGMTGELWSGYEKIFKNKEILVKDPLLEKLSAEIRLWFESIKIGKEYNDNFLKEQWGEEWTQIKGFIVNQKCTDFDSCRDLLTGYINDNKKLKVKLEKFHKQISLKEASKKIEEYIGEIQIGNFK
jgi:hypothetical protein